MPIYQVLLTLKKPATEETISILKKTSLNSRNSVNDDDGYDKGPAKYTAYEAIMKELIERVNIYNFFNQ